MKYDNKQIIILVLAIAMACSTASCGGSSTSAPTPTETTPAVEAPLIAHELEGYEDCVSCHGEEGIKPFPASHAGRTNDVCQNCHKPE